MESGKKKRNRSQLTLEENEINATEASCLEDSLVLVYCSKGISKEAFDFPVPSEELSGRWHCFTTPPKNVRKSIWLQCYQSELSLLLSP